MRVSKMRTGVLKGLASILLAIFAVSSAFAQAGTSGVNGTVTDQAGGSVPGATVRLVSPETGFTRTTTTNSQGQYSFAGIQPGNYRIEVEAEGFHVVPSARAAQLTMNRDAIRDLAAKELGLVTSKYRYAKNLEEVRAAAEHTGFPCVIKPVMTDEDYRRCGARAPNYDVDFAAPWPADTPWLPEKGDVSRRRAGG